MIIRAFEIASMHDYFCKIIKNVLQSAAECIILLTNIQIEGYYYENITRLYVRR